MKLLKTEIIQKVRNDTGLKKELISLFGCSYESIRRWCKENNIALTVYSSLEIISKRYNTPINELVEEI